VSPFATGSSLTLRQGIALCGPCPYLLCSAKDGPARDAQRGPDKKERRKMQSLYEILMLILGVARFFIFAHFIMSWLISFQVLNVRQPLVAQIWYGLNRLLDPIYAPIRRILPNMGGLDLSPIVALLGVYALEIILRNNIAFFV
jgi:YggT family protein